MSLMFIAVGIALGMSSLVGSAQKCEPAGAAVEVSARITGTDTLSVSYTVVNNTRTTLLWMSIGAGGLERTPLVPQQTPVVQAAPAGWHGKVVYPEETSHMHLWWEAKDIKAALQPGGSMTGFVLAVAEASAVPPGLRGPDGRLVRPIDFGTLPFTVGGTGGQCWWGRVKRAAGPPGRS